MAGKFFGLSPFQWWVIAKGNKDSNEKKERWCYKEFREARKAQVPQGTQKVNMD